MNTATVTRAIVQDLQRPGQHRVTAFPDQGVGVQQDAQHQGHGRLLEQHADEHLHPAQRDHPTDPAHVKDEVGKNGRATSSSRNPSFRMISVIAIEQHQNVPTTRAANRDANAISSRVGYWFPWNSE